MTKKRSKLTEAASRRAKGDLDEVMYEGGSLPDDFFASLSSIEPEVVQQVEAHIRAENGFAKIGHFKLGPTGVEIENEVTEDEWWAFWEVIGAFESAIQWIIGDALVYGDLKFGNTYQDVAQRIGRYSEDTLRQYAHVARTIPPLIRINTLSFGHHQVVATADLTDEQRQHYLRQAAENNWAVAKLRASVSGKDVPSKRPAWQKKLEALETTYTEGRWRKMKSESRWEAYQRLKKILKQMEEWGME